MEEYLRGVIDNFPEDITETLETPVASNLFNVREDNEQEIIDETWAQAFQYAVAQLLLTGIGCRMDTHTAIALMTTRARNPDKDNWMKLRRLIGYLKGTIKLPLIL